MALLDCKFFSETLGVSSSMRVILPEHGTSQLSRPGRASAAGAAKHPTLLLLHGLGDDETAWQRSTSIERYAAPLGLAVLMPNVQRSFYTNMRHGYRYFDFVTEELFEKARSFFPLSSERAENFVAGLSMGGYGAFKIAFSRPRHFAAAASLSGALDLHALAQDRAADFELIFGGAGPGNGEHDLFHLSSELAASSAPKPKLYQCCGTEDFLYESNIEFREHLRPLGFDHTYEEERAAHDWAYWDRAVQRVLRWLPLPAR